MISVHEAPRRQARGGGRFGGQCEAEQEVGDRFWQLSGRHLSIRGLHECTVPVVPDGLDPRSRARHDNEGSTVKGRSWTRTCGFPPSDGLPAGFWA